MNFYASSGNGYIPTYTRTDFTDRLHQAFGFRTDFEIIPLKSMKKLYKNLKAFNITHFNLKDEGSQYTVFSGCFGLRLFHNCQNLVYSPKKDKIIELT